MASQPALARFENRFGNGELRRLSEALIDACVAAHPARQLVPNREIDSEPIRFEATGVDCASIIHTQTFPHRLESSTLDRFGIIGLCESLDFLDKQTPGSVHHREMALLERLRDGLAQIEGVRLY